MISHFGRAVPVTCRPFPPLHVLTLSGDRKFLPATSPQHVVLLFRPSQVHELASWISLFKKIPPSQSTPFSEILFIISPRWQWLHRLWLWRCRRWKISDHPDLPDSSVGAVYVKKRELLDALGLLNADITNFLIRGERIDAVWQGPRLPKTENEVNAVLHSMTSDEESR